MRSQKLTGIDRERGEIDAVAEFSVRLANAAVAQSKLLEFSPPNQNGDRLAASRQLHCVAALRRPKKLPGCWLGATEQL